MNQSCMVVKSCLIFFGVFNIFVLENKTEIIIYIIVFYFRGQLHVDFSHA